MKIKIMLPAAVFTLLQINLNAQEPGGLQSVSKEKLESILKEQKQVRFVTANGPSGPEVKYYVGEQKPVPKAAMQLSGNGNAAVNFRLVKDINAQTDANPVNPGQNLNSDGAYAILNNVMYFSADNGINGAELWRSDGTATGTYMLRDIEPGAVGSGPSEIIVAGNKIMFTTKNNNYSLWISDGSAAGTFLLKDNMGYGPGVNSLHQLTNVSGTVYFFLNYFTQLWKTDGTITGTVMVKDFGFDGQAPFLPVAANGLLYFTLFSNINGRELWRSDGTNTGTFMVKDISTSLDFFSGPGQLTSFNNKLYFTANDGTGRKLWLTDGSTAGTIPASGQNNVLFPEDILVELFNKPFVVIGSNFYTGAITGTTGMELHKYNTVNGFSLVKDITPGLPGGQFLYYERLGNNLAFTYFDTLNHQNQLWRSGGTAANTVLIQSYSSDSVYLSNLHAGGNQLYFTSNASSGTELWKTNGTPAGTTLLKDIYAGATSANPANLTVYKGKVYFKAASKNAGTEMWQTDGTEAGTMMLPEINVSSTNYSAPDYTYSHYYGNNPGAALGKKLYFSATTPETGYELYRSNGTAISTALVADLVKGENNALPRFFLGKNHAVYFVKNAANGNSIDKVDSAGNVRSLLASGSYLLSFDVADNGMVFYVIFNNLTGKYELWRVADNGTGNIMISDKIADNSPRYYVKVLNNKVYFTAGDENGNELWVSNGTAAGTKRVKDIHAGNNSSNPFSLYAYNNNLFFGADDGSGVALWRSNGTEAGTVKVKNIVPYGQDVYNADYNDFFCVVNNVLYLVASVTDNGVELWKTNGTAAGTVMVKDIAPGIGSSTPAFLTNVNGTLFFSIYNFQLWKSDGTTTGTVIVKDNMYSPDIFLFTERCVADGKLFFNTGHLLWVSDGTDAGTHTVADNGLDGVSNIKNLVAADNIVYFNGTSDQYNAELYAGDATKITGKQSSIAKQVQQPSFSAVALQNPLQSQLKLQVQSFVAQSLIITVSNTNGNIIAQQTVNAIKGSNQFTLNASNWQTGFHAVKVSNTKGEMVSLKVLK